MAPGRPSIGTAITPWPRRRQANTIRRYAANLLEKKCSPKVAPDLASCHHARSHTTRRRSGSGRRTHMSEENKALVRRFYEEVWNKGNLDAAYDVFADDYVRHDLRPGDAPAGPEGQKLVAGMFRAAFPDVHLSVEFMVAEANMVVARWTMSGTHRGAWGATPPTGKRMSFAGVNIFRISEGKVVEIWNHRDDLGLMEQLGAPVYAGY